MSATPEREQAEALRELIQSLVDCEPEMSSHDFTVKALPLLVQASDALAAAAGQVCEAEAERDGARHLLQATGRVRAAAVERERELTRALAAAEVALSMASEIHGKIEFDTPEDNRLRDEAVKVFAFATKAVREALAGGVSAAGRPPEQDFGGNAVARAEAVPDAPWEFVQDTTDYLRGVARVLNARNQLVCETTPEYADTIVCAVGFMLNAGGGTAAVAEAGKRWRVDLCECGHPSATHARWGVHRAGSCSATVYIAHTNGANAYPCNCRGFTSATETAEQSNQDVVPAVPEVLPEETR